MIGPILLQVVLIFLNATFASAEIAVLSMNENKLKKLAAEGDGRAKKLFSLTEQPARFLATIQVAITLAGLLGSAFAADNFAEPLVAWFVSLGVTIPAHILKSASVFLITLVLAYFNLVFGELVPKRIAMKKADAMALGMSGLLYLVSKAFAPLVALLTFSTNLILKLMGMSASEEEEKVSEEEIRMLLATGNEQGMLDRTETEMIENIFEFDDISAGKICTHRREIVGLYLEDSMEEWEQVIFQSRHTYYPVFGEQMEDIVGILDTKDYFRAQEKSRAYILEHAVDPAVLIPEGMKANVLFQQMKQSRNYFAVVMDEYGGLSGIITLHDLMEELVGDLYEMEEIAEAEEIEEMESGVWKIQGCADLREVAEVLEVSLPTDVYDTFNGFVCGVTGKVPKDDIRFSCSSHGLEMEILSVKNHMVAEAIVRKAETTEPAEERQ